MDCADSQNAAVHSPWTEHAQSTVNISIDEENNSCHAHSCKSDKCSVSADLASCVMISHPNLVRK